MNTSIPLKTETHVAGLIVIERTHSCQTEANLALLNHMANSPGGSKFDDLYPVFLTAKGGLMATVVLARNLRSVLGYMVGVGYVVIGGHRDGERLYQLGDLSKLPSRAKAPRQVQPQPQTNLADPAMPAYVGQRVPPRQHDVMYGAVYVPGPSAAPRAGSLDFLRLASHGYGC